MTRDEEVRNAIDTIFPIPHPEKGRKYEQALMATGFEAGVKWADSHPKSPWISVNEDLPCNHQELLEAKYETKKVFVLKTGGFPDVDYMLKVNGKWTWASYKNSKFWMPIPEPPKE